MSAIAAKTRKRSSTACSKCRRMKIRCDVVERFPAKCSRCEKAKIFCEIDRQSTRLVPHPSTDWSHSHSAPRIPTGTPSSPPSTLLSKPGFDHWKQNESREDYATIPTDSSLKDQTLPNGMLLPAELIFKLFDIFLEHQYNFLPIFPKQHLTPVHLLLQAQTPLLFWTICAVAAPIASDRHLLDQLTWQALAQHVHQLLQQQYMVTHYVFRPFAVISHIFALLLLCEWPLPTRSTQEDKSWIYSGLAVHMGFLIGLHQSTIGREFVLDIAINRHDTHTVQSRTQLNALMWMGCFCMNQQLATFYGIPTTAYLDYEMFSTFDDQGNLDTHTTEFLKQVRVAHMLNKIIRTMGMNFESTGRTQSGMVDPACRRILHGALEADLSQLAIDISPMGLKTEIMFLQAKLHLHSFLMVADTADRDKIHAITPISIVAMQTIPLVEQLLKEREQSLRGHAHLPVIIVRNLVATCILLFRLSTCNLKMWLNEESLLSALANGRLLLKRMSVETQDFAGRCNRLFDGLEKMTEAGAMPAELAFSNTRLGSVLWETLLRYKHWCWGFRQQGANSTMDPTDANVQTRSTTTTDDHILNGNDHAASEARSQESQFSSVTGNTPSTETSSTPALNPGDDIFSILNDDTWFDWISPQ